MFTPVCAYVMRGPPDELTHYLQVGGIDAWAVVHAPAFVLAPLFNTPPNPVITVPGIIQVQKC